MSKRVIVGFLTICVLSLSYLICCNKVQEKSEHRIANKNIYNENANAKEDIKNALKLANEQDKNVLIMFGGNWCSWCQRLHQLFQEDARINKTLNDNYILVMVDVGKRDKNLDLNEKYGNPFQHGFPVLVVLDKAGEVIHIQETGSLEYSKEETDKTGHNPERILAFLRSWISKNTKM